MKKMGIHILRISIIIRNIIYCLCIYMNMYILSMNMYILSMYMYMYIHVFK